MQFKGKYGTYDVEMKISSYNKNGQTRLDFVDSQDGQPILTATSCIDEDLLPNEVAIKNYSENEGVLDFMMNEEIISSPLRYYKSGYVNIEICKINETLLNKSI